MTTTLTELLITKMAEYCANGSSVQLTSRDIRDNGEITESFHVAEIRYDSIIGRAFDISKARSRLRYEELLECMPKKDRKLSVVEGLVAYLLCEERSAK